MEPEKKLTECHGELKTICEKLVGYYGEFQLYTYFPRPLVLNIIEQIQKASALCKEMSPIAPEFLRTKLYMYAKDFSFKWRMIHTKLDFYTNMPNGWDKELKKLEERQLAIIAAISEVKSCVVRIQYVCTNLGNFLNKNSCASVTITEAQGNEIAEPLGLPAPNKGGI